VQEFAEALATTRAPSTVRAYVTAVQAFLAATPPGFEQRWNAAVVKHVARLRDAGRSPSTCDQALAALDAYGDWSGFGPSGVPRSGKATPVPQRLSARDAEFVYGQLLRPAAGPAHGRALAAFLLTTATKLGDALAVRVADVNLSGAEVLVARGKRHERLVDLQPLVVTLLRPLVAGADREQALFRNPAGTRRADEPLLARTAHELVREVSGHAPHTLTNSPRVDLIARGDLRGFYRHSGLERTAKYRYAEAAAER
jgi:integrase